MLLTFTVSNGWLEEVMSPIVRTPLHTTLCPPTPGGGITCSQLRTGWWALGRGNVYTQPPPNIFLMCHAEYNNECF